MFHYAADASILGLFQISEFQIKDAWPLLIALYLMNYLFFLHIQFHGMGEEKLKSRYTENINFASYINPYLHKG